jgi:hypothetical protein
MLLERQPTFERKSWHGSMWLWDGPFCWLTSFSNERRSKVVWWTYVVTPRLW